MSSKEQLADYAKRLKRELAAAKKEIDQSKIDLKEANDNYLKSFHQVRDLMVIMAQKNKEIQQILKIINRKSIFRRIFPMKAK